MDMGQSQVSVHHTLGGRNRSVLLRAVGLLTFLGSVWGVGGEVPAAAGEAVRATGLDNPAVRRKMLEKFDKDGDGKLNAEEEAAAKQFLDQQLTGAAAQRQAEMLKRYDQNGDGKLDAKEKQVYLDNQARRREDMAGKMTPEEMLKHFDRNGDGKLDDQEKQAARAELDKRRQDMGGDLKDEMVKRFDRNGDGKLDDQEKQAAHAELDKARQQERETKLKTFDTDGDGKLNEAEAQAMRAAQQAELRQRLDQAPPALREQLDTNHDGVLSPEEKDAYLKQMSERNGGAAAPAQPGKAPQPPR